MFEIDHSVSKCFKYYKRSIKGAIVIRGSMKIVESEKFIYQLIVHSA